jgi:predicted RNA polymerase sigma factor
MMGIPARPTARTNKALQDTAAGCRIRAEADLLASMSMLTANERIRLETSAASWGARAALLQGLDERTAARKAEDDALRPMRNTPLKPHKPTGLTPSKIKKPRTSQNSK